MREHQFSGIVYDFDCDILFANLYVYGFKKEKLPDDYVPMKPIDMNFDPNERIKLAGEWTETDSSKAANLETPIFIVLSIGYWISCAFL